MNININNRGQSFKGVTAYLLHDKKADTSERFEWGVVENTYINHNNDINSDYEKIQQATRLMAWTDKNRDFIKLENGGNLPKTQAEAGNVYHYSLAWAKDETPTREHMEETGRDHIKMMGLDEHQYYMVSHSDTDHAHLHIVANLVHPETGNINALFKDFDNSDRWANEYEKEHGIVSHDRAAKYEAWENDRPAYDVKELKAKYEELATFAYHHSDGMASFKAALEEQGLTLSGGRKSHVVVSTEGDIYNLSKLIDFKEDMTARGAKVKAINEKLDGLDTAALPDAKELAEERKHFDRDKQETDQQAALDDGAHQAAQSMAEAAEKEEALKHQEEKAAQDLKERKADNEEITERTEKAKFALDDMVKAKERGNIAVITSIEDNNRYGVIFTNKETGNTFETILKEDEFTLYKKGNYGLDTEGMDEKQRKALVSQYEFEMRERWADYQRLIDTKTLESRERWSINELEKARDNAAQSLADSSGFWASVTNQKQEAIKAHKAAELNLQEQRIRHEQDILVINERRPAWLKAKELEKHGFTAGSELEQIDKGNVTAHATTATERGLFAHIKAKITERANKKQAEKTAIATELKEREHQHDMAAKAAAVIEAKQRNEREAKQAALIESQQKETFERVRRLNMAEQFKENAERVNEPSHEPPKLQRDMTDSELQQHKDTLRAESQAETAQDTPAQEFEEVAAQKLQRDMNPEELAAYREDLREEMRAERERLEHDQGQDIDIERD